MISARSLFHQCKSISNFVNKCLQLFLFPLGMVYCSERKNMGSGIISIVLSFAKKCSLKLIKFKKTLFFFGKKFAHNLIKFKDTFFGKNCNLIFFLAKSVPFRGFDYTLRLMISTMYNVYFLVYL